MWQLTLGYGSLEFPKRTSKVQINLKQQTLKVLQYLSSSSRLRRAATAACAN
jgi:hypothetical protein